MDGKSTLGAVLFLIAEPHGGALLAGFRPVAVRSRKRRAVPCSGARRPRWSRWLHVVWCRRSTRSRTGGRAPDRGRPVARHRAGVWRIASAGSGGSGKAQPGLDRARGTRAGPAPERRAHRRRFAGFPRARRAQDAPRYGRGRAPAARAGHLPPLNAPDGHMDMERRPAANRGAPFLWEPVRSYCTETWFSAPPVVAA